MTIFLDFETQSEADLQKVGAWAYSEHPTTDVICVCWAHDRGDVREWSNPRFGRESERQVGLKHMLDRVRDGELVEAFNVPFEYSIWMNVMVPRYDWPPLALEQCRDTMAVACYYAMPAALDGLARALGLPGKDPEGSRLITKYSKLHLKTAKRDIPPEDLEKFIGYCGQDVGQEREAAYILGDLPPEEEAIFLHDLAVNARGLLLDEAGIWRARRVVEGRRATLEEEFRGITGLAPTQRDKVLAWLRERGLDAELLPDLRADTIDDLLDGEESIDMEARRALAIRRKHANASTKKLDAMLAQRGSDGRARFQTRYHGAVTGRNTGSGFQPLNLSRGFEDVDPDQLVRDIEYGDAAWLDCLYGDAIDAVGKASRHWIQCAEGERTICGDFTSIEAVVVACLAGEEWKIEAFRNEELIYERMGEKIHGLPVGTVTKAAHPDERQDGKVGELAFGFGGALGAWRKFDTTDRHSDARVIEICRAWRREHPMIVQSWYGVEDAALEAVRRPGLVTGYREIGFERVDNWLTMILPDGKRLWYCQPEIRVRRSRFHDPGERESCADGSCDCPWEPEITYKSWKNKQWRRINTYGGKLIENATQATARQILKPCELALQARGYPVVLSVYDEVVCNVPEGRGSIEKFQDIVAETVASLDWAAGWPIRMARPWEGRRYRK